MFTGIVQAQGKVERIVEMDADRRMEIYEQDGMWDDLALGASVSVNGACLTVCELRDPRHWSVDVSAETLSCTNLGDLRDGSLIHLERALRVGESLDGHWVSGHVDAVGEVEERVRRGRSLRLTIRVPERLLRYVARKGSVCVDGVSLTVSELSRNGFMVDIVPHTLERTLIGEYVRGSRVNIEVDLLARYAERLSDTEPAGANAE